MKIYCCDKFKQAVENRNIINEDYANGSWNPPVKYNEWYLSERDYNPYQEMYEIDTVLEPLKYCPWCRRKVPEINNI